MGIEEFPSAPPQQPGKRAKQPIVAYNTGTEQTVNLVLNTVKAAMKKKRSPGSYSCTVTKAHNMFYTLIIA